MTVPASLALAAGQLADPSDPPLSRSEADLAALPHSNEPIGD